MWPPSRGRVLQRVHRSEAQTLYGGRSRPYGGSSGAKEIRYTPLAARMRSSHSKVKQFSAAFQWIERSHFRIRLRSARYITFSAASSLGKASRGFSAAIRSGQFSVINLVHSSQNWLPVVLPYFGDLDSTGFDRILNDGSVEVFEQVYMEIRTLDIV
jgi:hypothetical protein